MSTPRKHRKFWAVLDSHQIMEVVGWECPGSGIWWCPEAGYTMTEGYHLFDDKESARTKAMDEISKARITLNDQERSLKLL